jgi:hypothetical protein
VKPNLKWNLIALIGAGVRFGRLSLCLDSGAPSDTIDVYKPSPERNLMHRLSWLTTLVIAVCAWPWNVGQADELPPKEKFHLFLFVAQSNMAGRGKVEASDQEPSPRVLMFNKDRQWVPAVDPMHFDKPAVVGVGLGRTFGLEIAKLDPEATIGLIPCAVGGSPIATWEPGALDAPTKTHPWDDAIARAETALKDGTLKGILWHQGESDCKPALAPLYEKRLHSLIERFRETLKAPNVPFIAGQMGKFEGKPWNAETVQVDAVHRDLPTKTPFTAFVTAENLNHNGDHIHFDAASYRELGRRYAAAYERLMTSSKTK